MFDKIKEKLIALRLGLADFEQRVAAGLFHGQPTVMAQHVGLNVKAMVGTIAEVHDALVAYETQTNNAVKLLDEEVASLKAAVMQLQEALDDPTIASEIVQARNVARQADFEAEAAKKREIAAGESKDESPKVGAGG